ncbi:MAG TPA: DoxX family protein, partial [Tepidisphaeraceae bacterium]|nr:DoxX family protein [Tepidisphaeraceae bacterium]
MTQAVSSATKSRATIPPGGTLLLALMRIAIGWHFLYEGVLKLLDKEWSAASYLRGSTGPLAEYFRQMAADPMTLRIVDQLNIWGLILVGLCLMLGLATRFAAFCGAVILALYYVAYPPLFQA